VFEFAQGASSAVFLTQDIAPGCSRNQLHCLPGLPEHLEEHLGLGLEQGDPMLQIGGMALELTADLEPITQQHRS
jgi:hypothetical protein